MQRPRQNTVAQEMQIDSAHKKIDFKRNDCQLYCIQPFTMGSDLFKVGPFTTCSVSALQ